MKILSILFLTIFLGKGCDSEQTADLEKTIIQYEANTRGFYQLVTVQNKMIKVSKDRNGADNAVTEKISDADWKILVAEFQKIDLPNLPNLKAPTEKRFYDGAAIGNLKVNYKDQNFETNGFDHGNPPSEIEPLVSKILSLIKKENDEN